MASSRALFLFFASGCLLSGTALAQSSPTLSPSAKGAGIRLNSVLTLDPGAPGEKDNAVTYLTAYEMSGAPNERIDLYEEAEIRRAGAVLRGNKISYEFSRDEVRAYGNALVAKGGTIFEGPELSYRLDAETGEMPSAKFRYLPSSIRGTADKIELLGSGRARMCNAFITTCKPGQDAWWIKSETLDYDSSDESAVGRDAVLYLGGVPIIATPYLAFPIGSERKSGLLTPKFGMSSTLGVNLELPLYWNIAPNYDYTLTAKPMSKRGLLLGNEFRYLQPSFSGQIKYDIIFKDQEAHKRRYNLGVKHFQNLGGIQLGVDYQKVSDDDYLSDFSTTIRQSSENILNQNIWLSYGSTYWSTSLGVYKNQTLRPNGYSYEKPYEKEPEFNLSGYVADFHGFVGSSRLTVTRFRRGENSLIGRGASGNGTRTLINSSLSYPLMGSFWHFTPKADYSMTWYNDIRDSAPQWNIAPSSSRFLPIFSVDSGLVFERDTTFFGKKAEQTFEPRLFYAYIPYRNQSRMPNFDSSQADMNFAELFSPNKFMGNDRISNTNQLSAVLSSRYIDSATGKDWFALTFGQRYYFDEQKVDLYWGEPNKTKNRSDALGGAQLTFWEGWRLEAAAQYSTELSKVDRISVGARYNPRPYSMVSLYYRYNYNPWDTRAAYYNTNIKQLDFSFQWPVYKDVYAVGRYNYSFRDKKVVDSLAGLEYRAGCWILRGAAQRYIRSEGKSTTNIFLELELVGLGAVGSSPIKALTEGIIGYRPVGPTPMEVGRYDYYE